MRDKNQINMTEGRPLPIILRFSVPLVLSAFFQQLYSFVDSMIVGRLIGVDALAAVNLTASLTFVFLGLTMGSALGFCVPFAQAVGAQKQEDMSRYFWNGGILCLLLSLIPAAIAVPWTEALLRLIRTPADLMPLSAAYLRIILIGQAATIAYNYGAGIIRSCGNSRQPLYFLLIASSVNLALDILFIAVFHAGVTGAALATVLSQLLSAALCFGYLFRTMKVIRSRGADGDDLRRPDPAHIRTLCVVGLPMGLELSVNGIGSVVLQSCVNQLGTVVVAAVAAGEKIRSMLTLPMENLGGAMSTYTAQNFGAGKWDRIKQGIQSSLVILAVYCAFAWVLVFAAKKYLVFLLLGNADPAVTAQTVRYLSVISCLFIFHGILQVFRSILQGMGYSALAIVSGAMEILGRVIGGTLAVRFASFYIICVSNPLAWLLAGGYCVAMTLWQIRRRGTARVFLNEK